MKSNTQLRGFHQGLFMFAQEYNGIYPGLSSDGKDVLESDPLLDLYPGLSPQGGNIGLGRDVWVRHGILIDRGFMVPEYAISPSETDPEYVAWDVTENITQFNSSYAMLKLGRRQATLGTRRAWRDNVDGQVPVASDRNIASIAVLGSFDAAAAAPQSVWTEAESAEWAGGVAWNDGHVGFENDEIMDETVIDKQRNVDDDLFTESENTGPDPTSNVTMNPAVSF